MIVDVRCRLTTTEGAEYFRIQTQRSGIFDQIGGLREGTEEAFFSDIANAGITTAVSVSGNNPGIKLGHAVLPDRTTSNDHMADVQRRNWGRFIGVASIDAGGVYHDPIQEIERCAKLGLLAVFIEPGRSPGCLLDDPRLYPIYQKCLDLDLTLIPQTSGPLGGRNIDYANPTYLEQVADDFPDLRILAGHACYPFVREAITMCTRRQNVYMSPDIYLSKLGTEDWLKGVNENIASYILPFGLADRFCFGTAYPVIDPRAYMRFFILLGLEAGGPAENTLQKRTPCAESGKRPNLPRVVQAGHAGRRSRPCPRVSDRRTPITCHLEIY